MIIREALHPYPDNLTIVAKFGARLGKDGSRPPADYREKLTQAAHDNLRNLGFDALHVVNLRVIGSGTESIEDHVTVLAELRQKGLLRHIGLSGVSIGQIEEARRLVLIVCVQHHYNIVHRADDAMIDQLQRDGIAMSRFSRWVDLRRSTRPRSPPSRPGWTPRRCRSRRHGCFTAHRTSYSFLEHRRSPPSGRIWRWAC